MAPKSRRGIRQQRLRLNVEALEPRCLLSCEMFARDGTLFVIGDEAANDIAIVGSDRGLQASCDGMTDTFTGITAVEVQAGDGDDRIIIDHGNGLLGGIAFHVFGQRGNDGFFTVMKGTSDSGTTEPLPFDEFGGGVGSDFLQIIGSPPLAVQFDIAPGTEINSCQIDAFDFGVSDVGTKIPVARYLSVDVETVTTKGGDGGDVFNVTGSLPTALNLFGEAGDDITNIINVEPGTFNEEDKPIDLDGGPGDNVLQIIGSPRADR